jgi:SRSO17 transposase
MLTLFGEWQDPRRAPTHIWVTDMTSSTWGALLRLTKLTRRVARDFAEVGDRVGLRDFVGRSFHGWHRHMTLASMAHTAALLGNADDAAWLDSRVQDLVHDRDNNVSELSA